MEKKMITFKLKEELAEDARQEIEGLLTKRLKATIARDKTKGNKGRWVLKLKKPEELTVEALEQIFKKAGVKKILRDVSIGEDDGDD
jgi:hypothetical protein